MPCLLLVVWLLLRKPAVPDEPAEQALRRQQLLEAVTSGNERLERELRREVTESARAGRQELLQTLSAFQGSLSQQGAEATRTQNAQIDAFAQQLLQLRGTLSDTLTKQLQDLSESNARRLAEVCATLEQQFT